MPPVQSATALVIFASSLGSWLQPTRTKKEEN